TLKKQGKELVGPCPICKGHDRFAIRPSEGVWHCRGCDKGGDVIALPQHLDKVDFDKACETLTGEPPPKKKANGAKLNGSAGHAHKAEQESEAKKVVAETYDYTDADGDGAFLFQVVRFHFQRPDGSLVIGENGKPKKTFSQRRPDPDD